MTIRRGFMGAAGCALIACTACGGAEEEQGPPQEPVIIESPRTNVLVGSDTLLVFTPTVIAYFVASPDPGASPAGLMQLVQEFQTGIQAARDPLTALGVRVEAVAELPRILGMSPAEDAAAGPPLEGTSYGYVFVDARGHVRRVTSRMDANEMVCTAVRTFGLTLSAQLNVTCG